MPSTHPIYLAAASFAARAHRHQLRKDGQTPYAAHPFRVSMIVRDVFGCDDPEAIAAALLHDTIEDTDTDFDDLAELFGEPVARMVAALTKNMALPEAQRETDYDQRLASADWRARLIKLADVYDNCIDCCGPGAPSAKSIADRARRALALATLDADEHEPTRRALERVREAMPK